MANKKVSDLVELVSADAADLIPIVDDSATETKKITFANLLKDKVDKSLLVTTGEPTGFTNNENITVSYDGTARTITLAGTFEAYYSGVKVAALIDGWVSAPHDPAAGTYFLYYNGTAFVWGTTPWDFTNLMIALVFTNGANFCLREVHGLMSWQAHKEFHETAGTYLQSGGDLGGITLASTTEADRRPTVSQSVVQDEDLKTTLPAIATNAYSHLYLAGAGATAGITVDNAEIIKVLGTVPYWNQFTGGAWQETLFSTNNTFGKIFVFAIPATADATCQKTRFIFVPPQQISTSLATIRAVRSASVNLGTIAGALAEFVFIGEIIIKFTSGAGGNWTIQEFNKLTGTREFQTATIAGNFLSTVAVNADQFTGDGTTTEPVTLTGVAPTFAADPASPVEGQVYFNSADKHLYVWNGTAWVQLDN